MIFCLGPKYLQAWSIMTGDALGEVEIKFNERTGYLFTDGLRVWACYPQPVYQGWDFGTPGLLPIQLPNLSPSKFYPNANGTLSRNWVQFKVQHVVTGRVLFQLPKSFKKPIDAQWNGQNLVICFGPTEVLILDFAHALVL